MKWAKYVIVALSGIGTLILAGCFFIPARPTGKIVGYVVDAGAGSPVVGARVIAYPLGEDGKPSYWVGTDYFSPTALTDADGWYELVVPAGTYTVVVEKEGYATSKVEGVVVASTARVDVIEKPVFNPDWPLEPPEVTVTIEGQVVTPGDEIMLTADQLADGLDYRVDAQGPNDISIIYAALGKTPGAGFTTGMREAFYSTYTTGDAVLNPYWYPVEGWTTFEVVVYDMNENRTHLLFRVYIEPEEPPTPDVLDPPQDLSALAVTLGKKVAFYGEGFTVPSGAGELKIQAAPEGGNLYVELTWDASPDDWVIGGGYVVNYRVYRRLAGEADYTLIGTIASGDGVWEEQGGLLFFRYYRFRDSSPDLQEGVEVSYQVRAFVGTTESAPVEASTTPLGIWDVRLLEPADGATGVSLTPTFRWEPTRIVGSDQLYVWALFDLALGGWYLADLLLNETEYQFTGVPETPYERLQPHRVYQWYIGVAIAYDDFDAPTAVSVAIQDGWSITGVPVPEVPVLPATDLFTFTTGDWGE